MKRKPPKKIVRSIVPIRGDRLVTDGSLDLALRFVPQHRVRWGNARVAAMQRIADMATSHEIGIVAPDELEKRINVMILACRAVLDYKHRVPPIKKGPR